MRKKITISEVAKISGVSTTTVSRVMSGTGRISDATRQHVFSVIERLDYQPSAIAKGLIESKTYNIGLVLSPESEQYMSYSNNFFKLFLQGAVAGLKKYEYDLIVSYGYENDLKSLDRIIKKQKIEGLIILDSYINTILKLKKMAFPFVTVGNTNISEVCSVYTDDNKSLNELILKYKNTISNNIAFLASESDLISNTNRLNYIKNILKDLNLSPIESFFYLGNNFFEREMFFKNLIRSKSQKLIITSDHNSLLYALNFFKENKIKIPVDIAIATFNDDTLLSFYNPSITAICAPVFSMGEYTANALMDIITKNEIPKNYLLDNTINYRNSTDIF